MIQQPPFKTNDRVSVTWKDRKSSRTCVVRISSVERREDDKGWYFGYSFESAREGSWGYANIWDTPLPYGVQSYSIIEAAPSRKRSA